MKKTGRALVAIGAVILLALAGPVSAGAQEALDSEAVFFQNLPDLPLMPGMSELEAEGVVFDQPEGRIIEAAAVLPRPGQDAAVRAFYERTLPALGWVSAGGGQFARDGETLKMEVIPGDGRTVLRIAVAPR